MAQTHYIEADEEIISAVGRLRKASEPENVFVFPKRALILQSIVNLKLLEREARKLGKKIVVVTQDNEGKALAEKAGLPTQNYQDEAMRGPEAETARFSVRHGEDIPMPVSHPEKELRPPRSTSIGSSDFYGSSTPKQEITPRSLETAVDRGKGAPTPLRIRNASPAPQASLNSARYREEEARLAAERVRVLPSLPVPMSLPAQIPPPVPSPPSPTPKLSLSTFAERQEKLHRFLTGRGEAGRGPTAAQENRTSWTTGAPPAVRPITSAPSQKASPSKAAPWAFLALGILSAVAVLGAAIFIFLPKAEVHVVPQGAVQNFKYQFIGTRTPLTEGTEANPIAARIIEMEKSVSVTGEATGDDTAGAKKARGTVVLSNSFSSASQPLVATTRLQTSDGKIFRLQEGITIPGMTESGGQKQPGVIEASVVADQSGESYNIGPAEFKISGFQGSSKYDLFSAKSTKPMIGGGSGTSSSSKSVVKGDLENAQKKAEEAASANFKSEAVKELGAGEKLLEESMDVASLGTVTAPTLGTSGKTFEYQARFKVRAFAISEQGIKDFISKQTITSSQDAGVTLKPVEYDLVYGTPLANFNEGKVEVSLQSQMVLRSGIDIDKLRSELLGQDEEGIRAVLADHPEIKRLWVDFKPKVFIASIPKKADRVTIVLSEEEEKK